MRRRIFVFLFTALLLADIGFSFLQHYYTPFDGDMAGGIVPAQDVKPILDSPLGIKIFTDNTTYPNPNKYFCHWSFYQYFNNVPLFLQKFYSPINSAYLSCAIAKTLIQFIIILLLSLLISGNRLKYDFLLAAVLITPLFQINGYRSYMGIIDPSTTYTFFYALPTILILLYFLPLFLKYYYGLDLNRLKYFKYLWIPLALISSLSGPLNPGISLVVCFLLFINVIYRNLKKSNDGNVYSRLKLAIIKIPKDYFFYLMPLCAFSIYSLFLVSFNSVDLSNKMPLSVLYSRLPEGLFNLFTQKLGFPILFVIIITNTLIINYKLRGDDGKKILNIFKWIGFFAIMYILLLPLGGYRDYRPLVLRYDTIIPITLSLMFIFGKTTMFILKNISRKQKYWYIPLVILVLLIFTNADEPKFDENLCERNAINQIVNSKDSIVKIDNNCTVLSWTIITNPKDSELNIKLLKKWNIISETQLYYQTLSHTKESLQ
ncbi:MAG: hypothetical protein JXR58_05120 [Bacteroidales bacterium]|nr:hypothetical protein [Bacteroidales bacterium]